MIKKVSIALVAIMGAIFFFETTKVSLNGSQSLPYKVFVSFKGMSFKRGDLVLIVGHKPKYFPPVSLIKRVVGMEGDSIAPYLKDLKIKTKTRRGQPLNPLKAKSVPKGYVFVQADHPDSFDSRYEEFGLVKVESIWGRSFGFWRRKK